MMGNAGESFPPCYTRTLSGFRNTFDLPLVARFECRELRNGYASTVCIMYQLGTFARVACSIDLSLKKQLWQPKNK